MKQSSSPQDISWTPMFCPKALLKCGTAETTAQPGGERRASTAPLGRASDAAALCSQGTSGLRLPTASILRERWSGSHTGLSNNAGLASSTVQNTGISSGKEGRHHSF